MRGTAVCLALLLCLLWTGAQGEDGGGTGKKEGDFDIQAAHDQSSSLTQMSTAVWAELKELRDKIQRLEQDNTATQVRLTASESKNAALEARVISSEEEVEELQRENAGEKQKLAIEHSFKIQMLEQDNTENGKEVEEVKRVNAALENRMSSSEKEVQELKRENAVSEARLNFSEKEVEELHRVNAASEARMSSSENQVEEVKRVNADLLARVTASENKSTAFEARMISSEEEVEELQRVNTDRPQVAFSAGLTPRGAVGPFTTDTTLKFIKVFTNIGQAYYPPTGIFTAPVRGAYYFRFNVWEQRQAWTGAYLMHNNQRMMTISNNHDGSGYTSVSNSMVLQLEKGDRVYIVLLSTYGVWDDYYHRIIFSGFLLFPQ